MIKYYTMFNNIYVQICKCIDIVQKFAAQQIKKIFPIGGPKNGQREERTEHFFNNKDTGSNQPDVKNDGNAGRTS